MHSGLESWRYLVRERDRKQCSQMRLGGKHSHQVGSQGSVHYVSNGTVTSPVRGRPYIDRGTDIADTSQKSIICTKAQILERLRCCW